LAKYTIVVLSDWNAQNLTFARERTIATGVAERAISAISVAKITLKRNAKNLHFHHMYAMVAAVKRYVFSENTSMTRVKQMLNTEKVCQHTEKAII